MKNHVPRHRAFTLIELLTVIAIIGILAAIMIPTIGKVRETAKAAQCLSNLRQVAMALNLYAEEYKGFYPTTGSADWIKSEAAADDEPGIFDYLQITNASNYWDYYNNKFKGTCLSCPTRAARAPSKFSYGLNELLTLNVTGKKKGAKSYAQLSRIGTPSQAMLLIESEGALNIKLPADSGGEQPAIEPWHGQNLHLAYADGHVGKIMRDKIPTAATDPFWAINGN